MTAGTTEASSPGPPAKIRLSPELRKVIAVTTLGSFMAFLDSTIVNVGLRTLSVTMHSTLATIQWLVTAYLLAMAAVMPISGWVSTRFGAKRMFIVTNLVFIAASLACGLSTSSSQLIVFRAIQGLAGGLAQPIGTMIIVRAAGPKLMARAMSVAGVPTILAPIIGPTIGGLLLQHAGWRWIFFVNVPIGIIMAILAIKILKVDQPGDAGPLDFPGVIAITGGSVALTYGLAEIGTSGGASSKVIISLVVGAVLVAAFIARGLTAKHPLVDLRLFKNRLYSAATLTSLAIGAVVFGSVILIPLYFQIVRHEDTVMTGLLLIPQTTGAAIAIFYGARLIDRFGSGLTAMLGGVISVVATVPFVVIHAHTSYWYLGGAMFIRGLGIGACAVPAFAAAFRAIPPTKIQDATVQLSVLQRIGGSAGTAVFAVVLQRHLAHAAGPAAQASAFGTSFWWVLAITVVAAAPTVLLTMAERRAAKAGGGGGAGPVNSQPRAEAKQS